VETFSRGTLEPWFVTGFVEGEGAFTFSRSGRQLALYFALKRPAADRSLLEEIQAFFGGAGRLYAVGEGTVYYRVCRREELARVVTHFDRYPLRGEKAEAYRIWREMVALKQAFRRPEREKLAELAEALRRG
jgi:hypothetical protein